jgi:nucleoside-diphosphate-sugar epimerase
MAHILVTGGCGYKGSVLTKALLASGHAVTVFDIMWFGNHLDLHPSLTIVEGDVRDTETVPMVGIDAVVHLANVANDPCCELDPKLVWEVNVLATMGLVERAINYGVAQFIYASSGSVYGVKTDERVTEDLALVPISDYNKTKMISERVLLSYMDRIAVQIVRPATVCGYSPRQRLDVAVNLLTMMALKTGRMTVFGGDQVRPNIHIKDMAALYQYFLAHPELTGIYNAGFENISILDIAHLVAEQVPAEIVVTQSNDPRSYRQCSDKLLATGFMPQYGVADGVRDVIEAYRTKGLDDTDACYNIRAMKQLLGPQATL